LTVEEGGIAAGPQVSPRLQALDRKWVENELRSHGYPDVEVAALRSTPLATPGAVGDIARIHIEYGSAAPAGPATVIAKIRGADEQRAGMDAAMRLYERELWFYSEFADQCRLASPRCLGEGDGTTTPLLLQDLADMRAGDQVAGMPVADAGRIVDALAAQHAAFWESPLCDEPHVVQPTEPLIAGAVAQLVNSGVPALREYEDRAPAGAIDAVERLAPRWMDVLHACAEGPHTLLHNDLRLDNVFFTDDGTPVFVDWQMIGASRGTQDVGNILAGSMNIEDLRQHWEPLLRRYHDGLLAGGVRDYSFDDCVRHYRQTILYPLGQGIALVGALAGRGGLADAALLRPLLHCHDLDAFTTI